MNDQSICVWFDCSGGVGPGTTAINQSNSQAWAETQSWLHTTASDGHGNHPGCMTTCSHANSSLSDTLEKTNYFFPNWGTGASWYHANGALTSCNIH